MYTLKVQKEILELDHDDILSGHLGIDKLSEFLSKVKSRNRTLCGS